MGKIKIKKKEYRKLIGIAAKVQAFSGYVNGQKYVDREVCGAILGFEVTKDGNDRKQDAD